MKFPKPWYRKSRRAWFVTLDGQQVKLAASKDEALRRYQDLLANRPSAPHRAARCWQSLICS